VIVGVGVDEVELGRFRGVLARTPSVGARLFTEGERGYAEAAVDPTARLAARFAAKEAVMKALGVGLGAFGFHECEVVRDDATGAPSLVLHGAAAALATERGVTRWHVSLTHTDTCAAAFVIAEGLTDDRGAPVHL
jgi:holo-[acyl-carrier protein] synthase